MTPRTEYGSFGEAEREAEAEKDRVEVNDDGSWEPHEPHERGRVLDARDQLTRDRDEAAGVEVLLTADVRERRGATLIEFEEEGVQRDGRRAAAPRAIGAGMAARLKPCGEQPAARP